MIRVISNLLFPLVTFPYASRILGPESIGVFNYAFAIASYFTLFAAFGFPIYGMREIAFARSNKNDLECTTQSLFTISIIFAAIALSLYLIICYYCLTNDFTLYAVIGSSILLNSISFEWFYQGIEDFKYLTVRGILIKMLSVIALFIVVKNENDLLKYAILNVCAICGNNILNLFRLKKYVKLKLSLKNFAKHLSGSAALCLGSIAISLYTYMNDIIVGTLTDMQSVAFFSTSNKLVHIVLSIIGAVTLSIVPRISSLVNDGDSEAYICLQKKTLDFIMHISVPMSIGLFVMAPEAINLFAGPKFIPATTVLHILSFLIIIISISSFVGNQILVPNKKEKYGNFAVIGGAIVNLITALIFIPRYSYVGAAISVVIAECFVTIVHVFYGRKYINLKISDFIPWRIYMSSIIMGILLLILNHGNNSLIHIIIWIALGAIAYIICLILTHDKLTIDLISQYKHK